MKKIIFIIIGAVVLVAFAFVFLSGRNKNQNQAVNPVQGLPAASSGSGSIGNPSPVSLGCTRTTGTIDSNILGLNGTPGGFVKEDVPYIQDLGVKWIRYNVGWTFLEPTEGVYQWNESDNVVRVLASENNIKLLSELGGDIPDWVWAKDRKGRQEAVYTMAKTVAARYKGKIRYYEISNEPNLPGFGFFKEGDKVDVSTYLDFLSAANKGVHEVDPNAVVVMGGLSPGGGMDPVIFGRQLYELGGKDCFDVFAFHPYGYGGKFKKLADGIRAGISKYGDSDKPIWFDELGAKTSEQVTFMNQMKDELSAVPAWIWFTLRDWGVTPDEQMGLLTAGYQKKPAYDLFKQILKSAAVASAGK